MGRRVALLIATYEYQDVGLRRLAAPAHDAESLASVLEDPDVAGFEVTTLVNEPHHRVGDAIGDLYRDRRRDDLTLLYFTGHGLKDDDGRLYLAMTNTKRNSLLFSSLSAEHIDYAMSGCASRQKILILDCCYSGAYPAGKLAKADTDVHTLERFQGRGRTVLTASDSTQYSFEGEETRGQASQSLFTRYLVEGLRDGSADLDGDGDITVDELYSYVHDRVVEAMPQQRPKKQDNVEGRTIIARNVNWSLPAYLLNAISSPIASDRLAALDGLSHLHKVGNDVVRGRIAEEIHRLAEDDSRAVSTAAAAKFRSITRLYSHEQPITKVEPPKPISVPEPLAAEAPPTIESSAAPNQPIQPSLPKPQSPPVPAGYAPPQPIPPVPVPQPICAAHSPPPQGPVRTTSASRPNLAAICSCTAAGLALLVCIIALIYRSDSGNVETPPTVFLMLWALEVAAVAVALTGFFPRQHLISPGQRGLFLFGIIVCFGLSAGLLLVTGLLLWTDTTDETARPSPLGMIPLVMFLVSAMSFPLIASIGRQAAVWTQGIAIAVGLLPFAWLTELIFEAALVGLPALALLIAIAITAIVNR